MSPERSRTWRPSSGVGAALNLVLLGLVFWGYAEAERWRTAWLLLGVPVAAAVLIYGWHLFKEE